jgi:polyisoprenyl-teichoic acid--peptidoglycan teichoic acid transferase
VSKRLLVAALALVAWVTGSVLGTGPSAAHRASAAPLLAIGQAHAEFTPVLDGSEPIFVLVIGSDARPGQEVASQRADSIHLVGINPARGKAAILGFPRDSNVPIPGHETNKINTALFYGGPELVVQTVEQLTGITIDYWAMTGFEGFTAMINGIDGFDFEVPFSLSDTGLIDFTEGMHHFDGRDALSFARNRHDLPMGDFGRSENQGRLMVGLLSQFRKEFTKDPSRIFTWLSAGLRNLQTDIPLDQLLSLAFTTTGINANRVENVVVPGTSGMSGESSIVILSPEADTIYRDMAGDGLIGKKNLPPSPNASLLD